MRAKALTFVFLLFSVVAFGQENLDLQRNEESELFRAKSNYNVQQRIAEIKKLEGKTITVFEVSGKANNIKMSYTGTVRVTNYPGRTDEAAATLITVDTKDENSGRSSSYYPLTNNKRYRIYLTEQIK